MNLSYKYPSIYWATACLTVNSGAGDENEEIVGIFEKEDENSSYEDLPDRSGKIKRTTNYGKLSSAIGRIKKEKIQIELPNINIAGLGFKPDVKNNSILYGLKGVSGVSEDGISKILINRPFKSFEDFVQRANLSKTEIISLIKAGACDNIEPSKTRKEIMYEYLDKLDPPKAKLTLANVNALINYNVLPESLIEYKYLFNFNKYLKLHKKDDRYILDDRAYEYFSNHFDIRDANCTKRESYLKEAVWDKLYKDKMVGLKQYMADNQQNLINDLHKAEIDEVWQKYCAGDESSWEMDTVGFYYHEHELKNTYCDNIKFVDFFEEPDIPVCKEYKEYKGKKLPVYELKHIIGTVLDKNAYKHTLTLLTPTGVVNVKCIGEQFSKYDKQISKLNANTNKKEIIEKSWFKRGSKIIVAGFRSGDQFMARGRTQSNTSPFYRIIDKDDSGKLTITKYRADEC